MSIHDYLIENQTRTNFRIDINNALSTIVSNNSNPTEPTTTFAYMWWADTAAGLLKQRNSSNTGWVNILDLTTGGSLGTAIDNLTNAIADAIANLGLGFGALSNITTGGSNVAIGENALLNLNTGGDNVAMGRNALLNVMTGSKNTALGDNAALATISSSNTVIGANALMANTTGTRNTVIGVDALKNSIEGIRNIAIGDKSALNITTEDDTITIGTDTDSLGSGYFTMGGLSSDRVFNQFTANATWTRASDERIKKDIETNKDCGLGFILDLRTVTYKFKAPNELGAEMSEYDKDSSKPSYDKRMYGFIAQEVKETLDKHDIKDFAGWHIDTNGKDKLQGISYEMFVMPLVKSVQELSAENKELTKKIDIITKRLELLEANVGISAVDSN